MSGKRLAWKVLLAIPVGILLVQVAAFIYYARPAGYPIDDAKIAVWDIYSQMSDNPTLEPAIQEIRLIAQEVGHVDDLYIYEASDARIGGFTTVKLRVIRSSFSYDEEVVFNHDGTVFKINSALSNHASPN